MFHRAEPSNQGLQVSDCLGPGDYLGVAGEGGGQQSGVAVGLVVEAAGVEVAVVEVAGVSVDTAPLVSQGLEAQPPAPLS